MRPRLTQRLRRALLWSVPAALALAAFVAVRTATRDAARERAREALAAGRLDEADGLLRGRADAAAQAGVGLVRILRDGAGAESLPPSADLSALPVTVLLDQTLRRGDFEGCRRLASVLADRGLEAGRAYRAAALLELGRDDEARAALASAAPAGLAREVQEALDARRAGARTFVRDRQGRAVGTIGADGRLSPLGADASWLRAAPVAAAASGSGAPGVRLTLDRTLSRLALQALGTQRGTIVILDPYTGAVRAAVSDPRTLADEPEPAWTQRREPASIAKLLTATAALRAGLDPDAEIGRMTCAGHATYGSGQLWCSFPAGPLTGLGHALAISCNVAFANLGLKVGRGPLLAEYLQYGFEPPAGTRSDVGRIRAEPAGDRQLADLAVGLEVMDITPVHAARLAGVFVEGRLPGARLLEARDGVLGRTPSPLPPEPGAPVLDPRWLPALVRAMEAVTGPGGTAEGLDPPGFQVAMKTGTAAEPRAGYHVNYVGVGPLPAPRLAFCIRLTHGGSSPDITRRARQVLATLLSSLAPS